MGDFINFLGNNLADFWTYTGFANATTGHIVMILVGLGFIYLAGNRRNRRRKRLTSCMPKFPSSTKSGRRRMRTARFPFGSIMRFPRPSGKT